MQKYFAMFAAMLLLSGCGAPTKNISTTPQFTHHAGYADYVVIEKSARTLTLWAQGQIIKTYPVLSLGPNPYGHKVFEGDGKTPEGRYVIDKKHESKKFQKFLRISYPNAKDIAYAKSIGMDPGGQVGIHGDKGGLSGFFDRMNPNWTQGCITVRNADIEEIYALVDIGTPIILKP